MLPKMMSYAQNMWRRLAAAHARQAAAWVPERLRWARAKQSLDRSASPKGQSRRRAAVRATSHSAERLLPSRSGDLHCPHESLRAADVCDGTTPGCHQ
jgi:hypothetical protein